MLDLHLHVLPAVDDGAGDDLESRQMLEMWADFGFTDLVATPHLAGRLTPIYEAVVADAMERVLVVAGSLGITLHRGYEIMLRPDLASQLAAGSPLTLGQSKSVLVEVPFLQWPSFTEQALFDIQAAGFRPVLAHPERYEAVQRNPQLALELSGRGVMLQVTFASLAGVLGRSVRRAAEQLVVEGGNVLLASDAHSSGQRLAAVPSGLETARALVGEARVRQMTIDAPRAMLDDEPLPEPAEAMPGQASPGRMERMRRIIRPS